MITRAQEVSLREMALAILAKAGAVIRDDERQAVVVSDFGLGDPARTGIETLTFFNTDRISAKLIILGPRQTCPEHWHPAVGEDPGKEEIMRVRWGLVYLYTEGPATPNPGGAPPAGREEWYTARYETVLRPGDQIRLPPGSIHWFQAGDEGAVIDDYATCSRDVLDRFTDPAVVRTTVIAD
ncbi:MAG: D-lyxose/D-mannose family sugar isomerase [Patescibacteria group bacterium]